MGIGIGDVASLAANSLGAAIGLGTKLPKYQDNSAQLELARMRAEAEKQKQYQKQLDDEKKNWQIPHDKIHPMIIKNETEPGIAKATIRIQELVAADPKAINGYEVYEQTQLIRKLIGSGIQQTQAMKDDFTSVETHPEIAKFRDPSLAEAIRKGDYTTTKALLKQYGSDEYLPNINVAPNIDIQKEVEEVLKGSNPQETDRGGTFKPAGAGQVRMNVFKDYDPKAVAYNAGMKWEAKPALQATMSKDDFTAQAWAVAEEQSKIGKQVYRTIPGAGASERNTITPEAQQYTVTLSSPTTSEKGRVYVDTAGNEYTQGITKKDIKKGTKTITAWVASDGKTQVTPKKGAELAITTSEYYPIGTANKLTANTSSTLVIDGQTGMQTSSIGKQFDINGIGKFDYVTDKNGKAVIVSDKSRGNLKQTPKSAYFAYAKEDLGMKEGEQKYRFYLVKVDPNIIRAAETAKIKFPDHVKQSAQGGGVQQATPVAKQKATVKPNITQSEYAKLKPGDKFWWDGVEQTKQ